MKTAVKKEDQPISLIYPQEKKPSRDAWNKGKLLGQKPPLKLKEVWEIRIRLQLANNFRELALFNLAIDSKLRGCDLVKLKVRDVAHGDQALKRTMVMQQKHINPSNLRLPSKPEALWQTGSNELN